MSDGEEVNVMRGGYGAEAPMLGRARERAEETGVRRLGRAGLVVHRNIFDYDRDRYLTVEPMRIGVSFTDVDDDDTAREKLAVIKQLYGVDKTDDGVKGFFDEAFFICYIFNGSSKLAPTERVKFTIGESDFDYRTAMDYLGDGARRFFRVYAKYCYDLAKRINEKPQTFGPVGFRFKEKMIMMAEQRGVQNNPYLIFDVAEHAPLTPVESLVVARSKSQVIGATPNAVDTRRAAPVITSLDNYDSTTGRNILSDHADNFRR